MRRFDFAAMLEFGRLAALSREKDRGRIPFHEGSSLGLVSDVGEGDVFCVSMAIQLRENGELIWFDNHRTLNIQFGTVVKAVVP